MNGAVNTICVCNIAGINENGNGNRNTRRRNRIWQRQQQPLVKCILGSRSKTPIAN